MGVRFKARPVRHLPRLRYLVVLTVFSRGENWETVRRVPGLSLYRLVRVATEDVRKLNNKWCVHSSYVRKANEVVV